MTFRIAEDVLSFSSANRDDRLEYDITKELGVIADKSYGRIDAANAILGIYNHICANDRTTVKPVFKEMLRWYVEQLDHDVERINIQLSYTRLPAVSQTAINMKNDLRETRTKLDALRDSLE